MRQNGVRSNVRFPYSKGGDSKKEGYTARKDESIAMRIKKKRKLNILQRKKIG